VNLSPEQLLALMGIVTSVLGLLVKVWFEVRSVHHLVNSRMTELLALTKESASAAGALAQRESDQSDGQPQSQL
jgi:hypothetical protein